MAKPGFFIGPIHAMVIGRDGLPKSIFIQPPVEDSFHEPIGRLIVQWAAYEKEHSFLLERLLRLTSPAPRWWTLPFKKRNQLLKQRWNDYCEPAPQLKSHLLGALAKVAPAHQLRDYLAHRELTGGIHKGEKAIRFIKDRKNKQQSKPYTLQDVQKHGVTILSAAGEIAAVVIPGFLDAQLPSDEIPYLQALQDQGRTPPSSPRSGSPPHQSSGA